MIEEVKIFERLKTKSGIEAVYKKGSAIISTDKKLKANYLSLESETQQIKIAVSVSSKAGSSVWRNRLKRIVRESLRQQKEILKEIFFKKKVELSIIFSPYRINQTNKRDVFLKDIMPAVADILNNISKTIIKS